MTRSLLREERELLNGLEYEFQVIQWANLQNKKKRAMYSGIVEKNQVCENQAT